MVARIAGVTPSIDLAGRSVTAPVEGGVEAIGAVSLTSVGYGMLDHVPQVGGRWSQPVFMDDAEESLHVLVNGGDIVVDRISGEIEVNNVNGGVTLTNVSGSVIAHALNKNVVVKLEKITADKSMSFSSLNGDVDVTLPADTKARVKLKTDNGEIYSDFEVKMDASSQRPVVEDGRPNRGKYRVRIDHAMYGTINGGGPEFQFQTFNGNVYIRKPK